MPALFGIFRLSEICKNPDKSESSAGVSLPFTNPAAPYQKQSISYYNTTDRVVFNSCRLSRWSAVDCEDAFDSMHLLILSLLALASLVASGELLFYSVSGFHFRHLISEEEVNLWTSYASAGLTRPFKLCNS